VQPRSVAVWRLGVSARPLACLFLCDAPFHGDIALANAMYHDERVHVWSGGPPASAKRPASRIAPSASSDSADPDAAALIDVDELGRLVGGTPNSAMRA